MSEGRVHELTVNSHGEDLASPFKVEICEFNDSVLLIMRDAEGREAAELCRLPRYRAASLQAGPEEARPRQEQVKKEGPNGNS